MAVIRHAVFERLMVVKMLAERPDEADGQVAEDDGNRHGKAEAEVVAFLKDFRRDFGKGVPVLPDLEGAEIAEAEELIEGNGKAASSSRCAGASCDV